ncbi:MAG: 30S ribosomal protein S10 [Mycoplasmataceae bacterium]|nr:30S ribosomal protein S10 [Mycoplasmataceae bacterium]
MDKINIKLIAYESKILDESAIKILQIIKQAKADFRGPVPLPTKREIFTVLRSVHINKKSREQFERRTHKRLIVINSPSKDLLDKLKRLELSAGVNIEFVSK